MAPPDSVELNVLVVPSWYPSEADPLNGIFVRDQVRATAALRPSWNVAVSAVTPRAVGLTRPATWGGLRRSGGERAQVLANLVEHRRSAPVWTEFVRHGNRDGLLAAHRANAEAAANELGGLELLHAHVAYPGGWAAMHVAGELGLPFVVTEHMGPFPFPSMLEPDGSLKQVVREPLERAAAVVAVSPALAADMAAFGLPAPRSVPNLVDETFFTPGEDSLRAGSATFFTLAALTAEKGIGDLLAAIALVQDRAPGARFRIGGCGPQEVEYRERAEQLELGGVVTWLGPLAREEVLAEYRRAGCVVVPSRHESFGIVVAEAMACGLPVLATRSGGPESIVTPETGALVDVADPRALADGIERMFEQAARYDRALIRRRFEERFSRPVVVDQLEQVYADAASRS